MAGTDRSKADAAAHIQPGPAIVLVRPQLGENIGATARAMLNFGLGDLRIVAPRDGWPNGKAFSSASGADVVLDRAQLFDDVPAAIADCQHVYATTARPRYMVKPVVTPREAAGEIRTRMGEGETVAVLFGAERAGLTNDDVILANTVITAPLNPGFASLNLAQAVLLVATEWYQAEQRAPTRTLDPGNSRASTAEEREAFYRHLEAALDDADFFRVAEKKPSMRRAIRNLFERAEPTDQEVRTLHGIVTALSDRRADGRRRFER
jgi:tRNA/rRNA methyltransferase